MIFSDADEKYVECLSWSHRQTELFLAEQATALEFDKNSALPPAELQKILNRIIAINPDYSETVILFEKRSRNLYVETNLLKLENSLFI